MRPVNATSSRERYYLVGVLRAAHGRTDLCSRRASETDAAREVLAEEKTVGELGASERAKPFLRDYQVSCFGKRNLSQGRIAEVSRESHLFGKERIGLFCHPLADHALESFAARRDLHELTDTLHAVRARTKILATATNSERCEVRSGAFEGL